VKYQCRIPKGKEYFLILLKAAKYKDRGKKGKGMGRCDRTESVRRFWEVVTVRGGSCVNRRKTRGKGGSGSQRDKKATTMEWSAREKSVGDRHEGKRSNEERWCFNQIKSLPFSTSNIGKGEGDQNASEPKGKT